MGLDQRGVPMNPAWRYGVDGGLLSSLFTPAACPLGAAGSAGRGIVPRAAVQRLIVNSPYEEPASTDERTEQGTPRSLQDAGNRTGCLSRCRAPQLQQPRIRLLDPLGYTNWAVPVKRVRVRIPARGSTDGKGLQSASQISQQKC